MTKRIVVKIGASLLQKNGQINKKFIEDLVGQLTEAETKEKNLKTVLVTSGAIATGMSLLGLKKRPERMSELQALAAVGQPYLMGFYQKSAESIRIGQILLTYEDLNSIKRRENLKNTIDELFKMESLPILNENDSTAVEEIKFGDNDRLSALVAELVGAQLLILLTDVKGLCDSRGKLIPEVRRIAPEIEALARKTKSEISVGGMVTKLIAAKIATQAGINTVVANGREKNVLLRIIQGEKIGTKFLGIKKQS